jgi:hypothetical protein
MIDISFEKERSIKTQDMYDIISFAIESANEGGFINTFVLERAIYVYTALILNEEKREKIQEKNAISPLVAWDFIVEEGIVEELAENHAVLLENLAEYAAVWADDRMEYEHSVRGLLDTIQTVSGDIVENMRKSLSETVENGDIKEVLKIANDWGLNREIQEDENEEESLFHVVEGQK